MNDVPNLTPPPERPLTPEQRTRLRSRLPRPEDDRTRSWLVPTVAAAAVVALVAGGSVALARSVGGDGGPRTVEPAAGASASAYASAPAPVTASTDPCSQVSAAIAELNASAGETQLTLTGAQATCVPHNPPTTCAHEVHDVLPGATLVAGSADGAGFWQAGRRWTLCAHDTSATTVHRVQNLDDAPVGNARFAFSTDHGDTVGGRMPTTFVAGGPLGGGDARIDYTFPDGHVQEATYLDGVDGSRWWLVSYTATDGPLADPRTNWGQLAPVVARLWGTDVSPPDRITLSWSADGCNQVNHGC